MQNEASKKTINSLDDNHPYWNLIPDLSKELATLREMKDNPPLLSIVICTFNTPPSILSSTLDSILKSSYANIEVCITDDGSTNQRTIECLRKYKSKHKRLKLDLKARNNGISEATNNSLKMCKGKFIAFIDHDDETRGTKMP